MYIFPVGLGETIHVHFSIEELNFLETKSSYLATKLFDFKV